MKNQVIEVLDPEHGKKVLEYWKNKGCKIEGFVGSLSKKNNRFCRYYGVIDEIFNNYSLEVVNSKSAEIITLPEEKVFPRVMRVSDVPLSYKNKGFQRVVFAYKLNSYFAWNCATTLEEAELIKYFTYWKYAEELDSLVFKEPESEEMTLEQVCKELGREIKIIK